MRFSLPLRHCRPSPTISRHAPYSSTFFSLPPLSLLPPSPSFSQILQAHAHLVIFGLAASRAAVGHLLAACAALSPSPPPSYLLSLYLCIDRPNVFAANNLLRCLARGQSPRQSLIFYSSMRISCMPTNNYTFPFLLQACTREPCLSEGAQVHAHAVKFGFCDDLYVRNALISFYSSCNVLYEASRIFEECPERRDVVSWNAMLAGCVRGGRIEVAEEMFDEMPERDVISWSTMIMGYVQTGVLEKAVGLFREMVGKGVGLNEATLVTVLSASAQLGLLEHGKFVHSIIKDTRFPMTIALGTALVDMYAKCGCIELARCVFDEMPKRDVFAWNAMICGMATHGQGKEALDLFQRFTDEGLHPTDVTFVGILNACSRAGLLDEARWHFKSMVRDYSIEPEMEHYGCMVDLLGRAGLVPEALKLIEEMSITPDPVLWGTLLGACKLHGFLELGIMIGRKLIELEPGHDGHYVLLASIYGKAKKWENVIEVRRLMSSHGTNKVAGWSLIEEDGRLHKFIAGDWSHKESSNIYKTIEMIGQRLVEAGYLPDVSSVLQDIEDEEKMHVVKVHSERLAIAYGLMKIEQGHPIRVVKNLRFCSDCHEFSKMVSKVFGREIVVRDGSRFHHFRDGSCSCLDYW